MVELHTTQFLFQYQSISTIRLCVLSSDDDNDHRICRQIHIDINILYKFWNLPMKCFYIFLISSMGAYYILFYLREKWREYGKRSKFKFPVINSLSINENKRDTFENEKVHEGEISGEEDVE